jgi:hypothetical protein
MAGKLKRASERANERVMKGADVEVGGLCIVESRNGGRGEVGTCGGGEVETAFSSSNIVTFGWRIRPLRHCHHCLDLSTLCFLVSTNNAP